MRDRCLVLSGGGNKIYAMLGAVERLYQDYRYRAFVGTSSGAILALGLRDGSDAALEATGRMLYAIRRDEDVSTGGGWLDLVGVVVGRRPALRDPSPVLRRLRAAWDPEAPGVRVRVGAVGLGAGGSRVVDYYAWRFPEWVLASSSVPPWFPPVELEGDRWVDWGVSDFAAIGAALDMGCREIDVVLSRPLQRMPEVPPKGMLATIGRMIGVMSHEVMLGDLREADRRNRLIGAGRPVSAGDEAVRVRVMAPTPRQYADLPATRDYLHFDPRKYDAMRAIGRAWPVHSLEAALELTH